VGLPAGVRPGFESFGMPSYCIGIAIGLLAILVRLGSFPWGKIKRHLILNLDSCRLAIICGLVSFVTGLKVRYTVAVLRFYANFAA